MLEIVSVIVSFLALAISAVTAWLTLFRRGTVRMTHPAIVAFAHDTSPIICPKVFLRTLLYSTAQKGQVIESIFIKLRHGESDQIFSFWGYGESSSLVRGSGLYVGQEGVAYYHHFLLPDDGTNYSFLSGNYTLETYATLVGRKQPCLLNTLHLSLTEDQSNALRDTSTDIFFDWGPESKIYHATISKKNDVTNPLSSLLAKNKVNA
jgi:hypothetical protein